MSTQEERNKFKAYWEKLGKPEIESKEKDTDFAFTLLNSPRFDSSRLISRIAGDRHYKLRWKWIQSDFKLPIKYRPTSNTSYWTVHTYDANNPTGLGWYDNYTYEEALPEEVIGIHKVNLIPKSAVELLTEGMGIMSERGKENGKNSSERSFAQVAECFTAKTGIELTAAHIALILQDLKDVRQFAQDRLHPDSIVDCINYAALKGEELYKQYGGKK